MQADFDEVVKGIKPNKFKPKGKIVPLEWKMIILDDVMGDSNLSNFRGGFGELMNKCWHYNLIFVFVVQVYNKLAKVIWS